MTFLARLTFLLGVQEEAELTFLLDARVLARRRRRRRAAAQAQLSAIAQREGL